VKSTIVFANLFAGGIDQAESSPNVHAAVGLHAEAFLVDHDVRSDVAAAVASPPRDVQLDTGARRLRRRLLERRRVVGDLLFVVLHLRARRLLCLQ